MHSIREQYWKYSLYVLILGLGAVIFIKLTPFLGGLLGAATIYVLLRHQMWYLVEQRRWRRSVAASLLLIEAVLCFLVPLSLIVWMCISKLQDVALDPHTFVQPLRHLAQRVHDTTGYNFWQQSNLMSFIDAVPHIGQWLVERIVGFAVNIVVLLFVLYFMLVGGCRMENYFREILPFNRTTARDALHEIHMIVHANAIGVPLLAVVQGIVAFVGYLAFGVPSPLFWGVLTCFATVIPIVGTALVWLPLAGWLLLTGGWGQAVGLVLYGGFVVTHVDNLVRLILQKKMANTHPLVTVFGVIIGLSLFGFMGVIFGPLLLEMFIFCFGIFKRRYLDRRHTSTAVEELSDGNGSTL